MSAEYIRSVICFLLKDGKNAEQIYNELRAKEGRNAPSKTSVYRWIQYFKFGRETVLNLPRGGSDPWVITQENVDRVKALVDEDGRITVREIEDILKIPKTTVHRILDEYLKYRKLSARWVPKLLSPEQKQKRIDCSEVTLNLMIRDLQEFLFRIITQDECYIHHYDPETKAQSSIWMKSGSRPPLKARRLQSAGKVLLVVFWDSEGVILAEYLRRGETVTGNYYAGVLRRLREAVLQKRRGKISRHVLLLQDNAPAHTAKLSKDAAAECGFQLLPHPPYSPDLAPSDYFLFPKLKSDMKGRRFQDDDDVIAAVDGWFESKEKDFYRNGLVMLQSRCQKCIEVQGDYVEK